MSSIVGKPNGNMVFDKNMSMHEHFIMDSTSKCTNPSMHASMEFQFNIYELNHDLLPYNHDTCKMELKNNKKMMISLT